MSGKRRDLPVPFNFQQSPLLIEHPVNGDVVYQRPTDGYINATCLCSQAGKQFGYYLESASTKEFLEELSVETGMPISTLVQAIGDNGTWVHPRVAIHLGQWLSPSFAVQVGKWVIDWIHGRSHPYMPVHVQIFMENRAKIPYSHFSMLNEIYLNLFAPLEDYGVIPPIRMIPDIASGQMFSDFLHRYGIDPEQFPTYQHVFADSSRTPVFARIYPIEYLTAFRRYFNDIWLPQRAEEYIAKRFPNALPFLPNVRQLPSA